MKDKRIDSIFDNLQTRLSKYSFSISDLEPNKKVRSENFLFEQFVARITAAYDKSNSEEEFKFSYFGNQFNVSESVASEVATKMPDSYYSRFGNGAYYLLTLAVHWQLHFSTMDSWEESKSPFEPILRLLERGGTITKEGKLFLTGNRSFREERVDTKIVESLSDEFLDSLDENS